MLCDGCNYYFSFCTIFCPFTALSAQKIKISIKKNEVSSFYLIAPKIMIILDTVPEIYGAWNCYFSFSAIFDLLPT